MALLCAGTAAAAPGDLDGSFATHGIHPASAPSQTVDLEIAADGSILTLLGENGSGGVIEKLTPDGSADTSFGTDGQLEMPEGFSASSLTTRPGGGIDVTGVGTSPTGSRKVALARFGPDGAPNLAFGDEGITRLSVGSSYSAGADVIATADGGDVIATTASGGGELVKVDDSGELDAGFGTGGVTELLDGEAFKVASIPGGGFLLATSGNYLGELSRFKSDGSLDRDYGEDGTVQVPGYGGDSLTVADLVVDSQDRAIIASVYSILIHGGTIWDIDRITAAGEPDTGFSPGVFGPDPVTYEYRAIYGLSIDGQDRVLVAGASATGGYPYGATYRPVVGRMLPDGSLDPSFGVDGLSRFPTAAFGASTFAKAELQPGGDLVVSGAGVTARFLTQPGPSNADADPLGDADDPCPRVPYFGLDGGGCPDVDSALTIAYKPHHGFSGVVSTADRACRIGRNEETGYEEGVELRLLRVRKGPDKVISTTRLRLNGPWGIRRSNPRPGRYYALIPEKTEPFAGICTETRSPKVKVTKPKRR